MEIKKEILAKQYTVDDLFKAKDDGMREVLTIIHYILNKNSRPLPDGVNFEKVFDELQDLEHYLYEILN